MEERREEELPEHDQELEEVFPIRRSWGKWVAWLVILIVLIAAGWYGYKYYQHHKAKPQATFMPTARVTRGNIDVTVSGSGSIQPINTSTITGPSQGTIKQVLVKQGDKIKKGQVIATLDQSSTQNQINQDQVNLQKDQIDVTTTEDQIKQATDQNTINNLKITLEKTQLDMTQLQTTIASLEDQMKQSNIIAPISGTLDTLSIANGDSINGSTSIGTITDYSSMEIVTNVDELDISKVKVGQTATITIDALTNQKFKGKVTNIAKQGTSSNGVATFPVTIKLDSIKNVLSGMSAEASVLVQSKQNVLLLPIEAVQTNGKNHYVLLQSGQGTAGQNSQTSSASGQSGTSGSKGSGRTAGSTSYGNRSGRTAGSGGYSGYARQSGNSSQQGSTRGRMQVIQVGVHNDNYIEVTSGLSEGDVVQIPITTTSSSTSSQRGGSSGLGALFGGGGGGFGGGARRGGYGGGSSNRGGN